jgi:hypothetical protein
VGCVDGVPIPSQNLSEEGKVVRIVVNQQDIHRRLVSLGRISFFVPGTRSEYPNLVFVRSITSLSPKVLRRSVIQNRLKAKKTAARMQREKTA